MSLSTPWSLLDIRFASRTELLDPNARWFSDVELNQYALDWQNIIQTQFEFVWAVNTYTMVSTSSGGWGGAIWGSSTFAEPVVTGGNISPVLALDTFTDMLRLDAVYFCPGGTDTSTFRLSPRSIEDLDRLQMDWRTDSSGLQPELVFQVDANHIQFWPPPPGTGTYIFEYPIKLTFINDASLNAFPGWTRYDPVAYITYRALSRFGPNQDLPRAARYRKRHETNLRRFRRTYDAYFPEHAPRLTPGGRWAGQITNPRQRWHGANL